MEILEKLVRTKSSIGETLGILKIETCSIESLLKVTVTVFALRIIFLLSLMYNCSASKPGKTREGILIPYDKDATVMMTRDNTKVKKLYIINWIFEIILFITLFVMYYLNQPLLTTKVLHVPSGSIGAIITHLKEKKISLTSLDKTFLRFIGSPQQGWIYMGQTKMNHGDFLYKLTTAKAAMKAVTLIPGETTYGFSHTLAEEFNLDETRLYKEFMHLGHYKEGALVPDTYHLPLGITEHYAAVLLLRSSALRHQEWAMKIFGKYNKKKWQRYLIIASIVQKEAANKKEMPLVSSVVYNRLKKGMKLQMDGSLNYGKYSHQKVTATRIRNDKSHYNTYKYRGLPPEPVCNVELSAIKAAIFPAKTEYLYFVVGKKGTHRFTSNYFTHVRNIRNATK